ncbi:hypothetical protein [Microbacterium oxydans]|uniref:hypothetical protein n=1 Tax=Microbacterium oxydans TaxID=82380 RepID=UPI0037CC3159
MNERIYLVDNNVLAKLTRTQLGSQFFRERCRVPDEVVREAGPRRAALLEEVRFAATPVVLRALTRVMAEVVPGDIDLVDLYRNKGSADPFLIACALVGIEDGRDKLFAPDWVLVTEDRGVRKMAERLDVEWQSKAEFVRDLDSDR